MPVQKTQDADSLVEALIAASPALRAFAEAAGEIPENRWWLGFEVPDDEYTQSAS